MFTTENDLVAAVLDFDDLKFSKRHEYNPVASIFRYKNSTLFEQGSIF
ncbi:hypothetical protein Q757_09955 [Oenococcus alcoholitolerans]|uniref:Uncharacterized protein n=1 Tax=Oenococcus alcoholitolerans TaxID=931074 RepID=A0ABR4XNJ9_9LACO|nr:hypothetical protein Q757_09955 [Oenococcus alcoholitolerans]